MAKRGRLLLNAITAVVQTKLLQAKGFISFKRGLISQVVGQVIENDRKQVVSPWVVKDTVLSTLIAHYHKNKKLANGASWGVP